MRMRSVMPVVVVILLAASYCGCATYAAENKGEAVTAVYKNGDTLELKSLEVGFEDEGLFGASFKKLKKLPIKAEKLRLEVPIENLAKIEFVSVGKEGKDVKVKLTALDGKTMEGVIDHEKPLIWKGKHAFADSEATLDPAELKEIILRPEKK